MRVNIDALLEKVIDTIGHDNYAAVYTSTSAKVKSDT